MIVKTRNSVYRVDESSDGVDTYFRLTKIEDLVAGGHPNVRVGDYFVGRELRARVGEHLELGGVTDHHHPWRPCRYPGTHSDLTTSTVTEILPDATPPDVGRAQ